MKRSWTLLLVSGICLSSVAIAANGDATYTYDTLGRLVEVVYGNGSFARYSYDAAGNRHTVVTGAAGSATSWGNFNWNSASWGG